MAKLSEISRACLKIASEREGIDCYDALKIGANGKTLSSLTGKGLLSKERPTPNAGWHVWRITDAGRALISRAEAGGEQ